MSALLCLGAGAMKQSWLPFWLCRRSPQVELLEGGAEPRTRLAYEFARSPRAFNAVVQGGLLRLRGPLQGDESYAPPVLTRWIPEETTRRFGTQRVTWRLEQASTLADDKVADSARQLFDQQLALLIGQHVVTYIGRGGRVLFEWPEVKEPGQKRLLDDFERLFRSQYGVPLPAQAVGKGAKWSTHQAQSIAVAEQVEVTSIYRLTEMQSDGFDVSVQVQLSGASQVARPSPGVNESIRIDDIEGSGSGRMVRMWNESTPVHSDRVFEMSMSLSEAKAGTSPPTPEQRLAGYRMVFRSREVMQAVQLGPIDWAGPR